MQLEQVMEELAAARAVETPVADKVEPVAAWVAEQLAAARADRAAARPELIPAELLVVRRAA